MPSSLGWTFATVFLLAIAATRTYYAVDRSEMLDLALYGVADFLLLLATVLFAALSPKVAGAMPAVALTLGVLVLLLAGVIEATGRARQMKSQADAREADFFIRMRAEQSSRGKPGE